MKFAVSIILCALLALACGYFLPWWSIALATFTVCYVIVQKPLVSFLSGFIGVFLLWLIMAVRIDSMNDGILAARVSQLMGLGSSSATLILITCLIGGIVGGMGGLTAGALVNLKRKA